MSHLKLTIPKREPDAYPRARTIGDVSASFYRHGEFELFFPKSEGQKARFSDAVAKEMQSEGVIDENAYEAYLSAVSSQFHHIHDHSEEGVEKFCLTLRKLRFDFFGATAIQRSNEIRKEKGIRFDFKKGIDQRTIRDALLLEKKSVLLCLFQPECFALMLRDLRSARENKKKVYCLVSPVEGGALFTREVLEGWIPNGEEIHFLSADASLPGGEFSGIEANEALSKEIDKNELLVLAYGEDALIHCRGLTCDAFVCARPLGYYAQALTNQLAKKGDCAVFVPKALDLTQWVPIVEKTILSYWHLYQLHKDYGMRIYSLSPSQLYQKYPTYFLNIYADGPTCREAEANFPLQISFESTDGDPLSRFEELKNAAIHSYIQAIPGIQYRYGYFDETLQEVAIPSDFSKQHKGILVHSVRIRRASGSKVINCDGVPLREQFSDESMNGIVSNFLFFLTPKLAALYNELRLDRPYEVAKIGLEHLDYMLTYREGERKESFPLFQKTCIAMKENGEFLFFRFRLGKGTARIQNLSLAWDKKDVDATDMPGKICIYTPYLSVPDREEDRQSYRKAVGNGRINLVVLQDKIQCVRDGDVILPSIGVVISLERAFGLDCIKKWGLPSLPDGYYQPESLSLSLRLDAPEGILPEDWSRVRWAYGGGLSLILEKESIPDRIDMEERYDQEGWMSPLSRQTQESALHKLVKHPRTAIGTTENGDLIVLVFSGRTKRSTGADYREMCAITKAFYPDVKNLMNVDGGGSAMLGLVCRGSFMELSCPSTSTGSCAGMVRPIRTVLYITQEANNNKEEKR